MTLKELAAATKRTIAEVEAEALGLDVFIGEDWAGRPAMGERDARQLVTGEARRIQQHELAWRAFLDRCAAWGAVRDEVVQAALDAAPADPRSGPQKHAVAREAAAEAGRRFEESTPPPTWVAGVEDGNAVRRYTDRPQQESGSLLERTIGRVKAGAR